MNFDHHFSSGRVCKKSKKIGYQTIICNSLFSSVDILFQSSTFIQRGIFLNSINNKHTHLKIKSYYLPKLHCVIVSEIQPRDQKSTHLLLKTWQIIRDKKSDIRSRISCINKYLKRIDPLSLEVDGKNE